MRRADACDPQSPPDHDRARQRRHHQYRFHRRVVRSRAAAYTASKHAVVGLTKNVGFQYADAGIRCNAIAPGGVETNIMADAGDMNPESRGLRKAMSGAGFNPRNGKPEEIAKIALFLASDDSSFINGTVITADAGWTAY